MSNNPFQNPYESPVQGAYKPSAAGHGELASRLNRFLGSFIDGLIVLPLAFVVGMGLGFVLVMAGINPESTMFNIVSGILGTMIGAGIYLAINGYLLATRGQTVGKIVMKTQIVSDSGQLLPFGHLVLKRYLPIWGLSAIPYIGGIFSLANALFIFRENKKCLHDDIAGTKVIQLNQ